MALATPENVEVSLMRDLTETESLYVEALLDRAERKLLARVPDLLGRAASSPDFTALVADVEAEMLARVFRAEGGGIFRQEMEGNYSYSLNLQVASGLLDVLDKEWALLGAGSWGTVAPATDGYLAGRYQSGIYPWQFQAAWPAHDEISEQWWWGP